MNITDNITLKTIEEFFNNDSKELLENLAAESQRITNQYFGRTISLYSPLYIANYCENHCTYCGFNSHEKIKRNKLSLEEIEAEAKSLAETGVQNILILTGESRLHSPVSYIKEAVVVIKKYFPYVAIEVFPMETEEYRELFEAGVDGVTIYQETYNREIYDRLHLSGKKKNYNYRLKTPDRIASSGIRQISIGALLGLAPWKEEMLSLFEHLIYLEKTYPAVEFSLSFPRIRKINNDDYYEVSDIDMVKIICAARILFPRVGINISTRESADFRDNILPLGITRISAGSSTTVGGYSTSEEDYDPQFSISDDRSLADVKKMLLEKNFDPVFTDWRRINNS